MGQTIKLHAFLAHAGVASRRASEELIAQGKVCVNGTLVKNVATRIDPNRDRVEMQGKRIELPTARHLYYVVHKPVNYVSSVSDPDGKPVVISLVPRGVRVYPVGRLDSNSEGLILMTNDGDLAYRLTHPKFVVPKTYHVLIAGSPGNTALNALRSGVHLSDGMTAPAEVSPLKHDHGNTWIVVTIHEGKNRQIRRMCGVLNLEVLRLIRVKMGPFELGALPVGGWRHATDQELRACSVQDVR